jgi:excisionase family DNA binding protein
MAADWLSLSEAANLLGVHPSTVRSWSDQEILPVHRTQGGHRRYLRSEIELWMQAHNSERLTEPDLVTQTALRSTRFQISEGRLNQETWYNKLDEDAREQYRQSGRALLLGLINFLNANSEQAVLEARAFGYEYAARGRRCGLNSVEAAHAFLFFRNMLMESMLAVYESAAVRSPYAWSSMFRKINEFTDYILIELLQTYEVFLRGSK